MSPGRLFAQHTTNRSRFAPAPPEDSVSRMSQLAITLRSSCYKGAANSQRTANSLQADRQATRSSQAAGAVTNQYGWPQTPQAGRLRST